MITMNESSNWIAQHYFALGVTCLIIAALAASVFISALSLSLPGDKMIKYPRTIISISAIIFVASGYSLFAFSAQGPHYSGSSDYKVKSVKQDSSSDQTLIIDDGKRDVELNVDNDKTSYSQGDDVRVTVNDKGSSLSKGKYHLGDALRPQKESISDRLINVTYDIKKID